MRNQNKREKTMLSRNTQVKISASTYPPIHFRPNEEDSERIDFLQKESGISNNNDLLRYALKKAVDQIKQVAA